MDEDVSHLIQNFQNLSSPVQATLDSANESILELIQNDPMLFLFLSAKIMHLDDLPDSVYRAAITLMGHALTPSINVPITAIGSVFLDPSNSDRRKLIKEAVFRGLMFTDQSIRHQASYCVNLILQIETDEWSELLPSLFEVANSSTSQYSIEAHCGVIYCYKIIIQSSAPFEFLGDSLENFYFLITHFLLGSDISSEILYDECFDCFISILDRMEGASKIDNDIAIKCFEIIEKSISNFGFAKTKFFLSTLFTILKGVYSTSIFDYLDKYLEFGKQILQDGDFEQQIGVIMWWDEIAQFEYKQEERQNIINSIAEDFFPIILKLILAGFQLVDDFEDFINDMIEFDKTSDKNESSKQILSATSNCLSSFYKVAPETIFSFVSSLWNSENFSNSDQVILALFTLSSIIKRDPWNNDLVNFIGDTIRDDILKLIHNENNIYISILALVVISKSTKKFGSFIYSKESIDSLLLELQSCSERNKSTIQYCCTIITGMCIYANSLLIGHNENIDDSILSNNCDQILQTLNFYVSETSSPIYIRSSFAAFCMFISVLPQTHISILPDIQENIVKKTLTETLSNSESFPDEETLFTLQISMINMIEAIASRYYISKTKMENADELIQLLFALVNQKESTIYEETLPAFSSIIFNMENNYAPFVPETMDMILIMLETGNTIIIQQSINTISDLFRLCDPSSMESYTSPVFKLLIPMIYEGNLERELVIDIVSTLADATKNIKINIDDKTEFLNLLFHLKDTVNLNPANKSERKFIGAFFEIMFYAFAMIIECSLDDHLFDEIEYETSFFPLIQSFLSMKIYESHILLSFMSFIKNIVSLYRDSGNVILKLNSSKIRQLIEPLKTSENDSIRFAALDTWKVLSKTRIKLK